VTNLFDTLELARAMYMNQHHWLFTAVINVSSQHRKVFNDFISHKHEHKHEIVWHNLNLLPEAL
jgi:hypothetical protein